MSPTVACDDQTSPLRVKRKPAPPAATVIHQSPSSSSHRQSRPQQPVLPSIAKPGLSERYPDPDPTDPFAPLWVLRNRTCSASPTDVPPAPEHSRQRTDECSPRLGRSDRRHSTSYLLQSFTSTSSADGHECINRLVYASDHGHGVSSIGPRTNSYTNGATGAGVTRRQPFRPTRLSQVTALAIPSVSKDSPVSPISSIHISHVSRQPPPTHVDVEGSVTNSDPTRVGSLEAVELTPQASMQPQSRSQQQHEVEIQEQEGSKSGPANNITRFLRTRRTSQSDSRPQTARASVADINRIRKASISPPVTSSVVWASQGQDFAPINDHPLHRAAIPIVAATLDVTDAVLLPLQAEGLNSADVKQCSTAAEALIPIQPVVTQPSSTPKVAAALPSDTPVSPPGPPTLANRHSQTSRAHTDESHSTFSFVHVPSTFSSTSLAHFTQENVAYEAPVLTRRPSTAPLQTVTGPGVCATIASSATMRMKRRSSFKIPLTHTISPLSPLNSTSTALSPIQSDSGPTIGEWDMPTFQALSKAASLPVIAESGIRVNFGSLFLQRRAVVVFIRHFWCPLCQDYMTSVTSLNQCIFELLFGSEEKDSSNEKTWGMVDDGDNEGKFGGPLKLIVIGNGSYTMIGKYKQIFGAGAAGLEVYTDPSLAVYNTLGMRKDPASLSDHAHPFTHRQGRLKKGRGSPLQARLDAETLSSDAGQKDILDGNKCSASKNCSNGGYVKHGLMGGIAMVFMRALKVGMPVWEKGGDLHQLGGEFVFGPGLTCAYAHRMQTTKGHAPIEDALCAAGVIIPPPSVRPLPQAKARDARAGVLEKKVNPRSSKSPHSSMGDNKSTAPKLRSRGQTIGGIPISAPIAEIQTSVPVSASTPSFSSEPTQARTRVSQERRKSLRNRQKSLQLLSDEVPIVISGPDVRPNGKQTFTDHEREWNLPVPIPVSTPLGEPDWTENRHRSLQAIKERKNARRGLSSVEERQVISASISISKSKSHSHSLSPPGPVSTLCPMSQASQNRQYRERPKSRLDYESGCGPDGASVVSDRKATKGRSGKGPVDVERVAQSDTGGINVQMKGRGGDDVVSLARERKVNLSREHLAQREREELKGKEADPIPTSFASGEDVKIVSDMTFVHQ